jgi:ubiquinone/menaquinone biosynthesis C-methylase UbiE
MGAAKAPYVCGHSAPELRRLEAQGAIFEEISLDFLRRAGVRRGMRVLDVGCGAGDLSLLAARLVGGGGAVLGLDRARGPLVVARRRAASRGLRQARFRHGEADRFKRTSTFDAAIGRFVLMHQPDPAATLRAIARHVRPGGLVALLESHLVASVAGFHSYPHSRAYDDAMRWMRAVVTGAGAHADMGLRLWRTFVEAGLPPPRLSVQAQAEGGPRSAVPAYVAQSVRSMASVGRRLRLEPIDAAALEPRLREEAEDGRILVSPLVIGAWCRLPGSPGPSARARPRSSPRGR